MAPESAPRMTSLRLSGLSERRPNRFELDVSDALIEGIVQDLGLQGLRRLRFVGIIERADRGSWRLEAELGATATQTCVVSLAPVVTRIDAPVQRSYCPEPDPARAGRENADLEVEMPEDETIEPLVDEIDLVALATESLSLSLPDYPRAADAAMPQSTYSAPGITPMSDADAHPFAVLSKLRKDQRNDTDTDPDEDQGDE